jgi:hypothetical protein
MSSDPARVPDPRIIPGTIPNRGPMNAFVGPFDVSSRLTDDAYQVRFSHLWNAIATRHADTVDAKFLVDGSGVIVGLAHPGIAEFARRAGRPFTDRELSFIAAEYLRERLEEADKRPLYDVSAEEVIRLAQKIGLLP